MAAVCGCYSSPRRLRPVSRGRSDGTRYRHNQRRNDSCWGQDLRRRHARARSAKSLRAQPNGEVLITDGPYLEAKEHVGGFWVVEAADMEEALAWGRGRKAVVACRAPVEVRQVN